jgi:hypothetical protein
MTPSWATNRKDASGTWSLRNPLGTSVLLATGYEQVRSVVAALAGDREAADTVQLELPETGVCSTDASTGCDVPASAKADSAETGCCGTPEPVLVGFPTGLAHGRSGSN